MTLAEQYRQEGLHSGRLEGIRVGRQEGKNETIKSMVLAMQLLKEGKPLEQIVKLTQLPKHELESLKRILS